MTDAGARRDYVAWHDAYDDAGSTLSWRLSVVRSMISDVLDHTPGDVRILSSCAGDGSRRAGRARRPPRRRSRAGDPARGRPGAGGPSRGRGGRRRGHGRRTGRRRSQHRRLPGAVPADLVLLVGIFGNITLAAVEATVRSAPQLCAADARVVWSLGRGLREDDVPVGAWFEQAGFVPERYEELDRGSRPSVGLMRLMGEPSPLQRGARLFEFVR